jgi:D-3-phosphoglycerate dehydrogenase / 2-oxoglutarate reductase
MTPAKRWKVLISAPYAMPLIDMYRERLGAAGCEVVVAKVHERLEEEELLPLVPDIDGIICGDDRITPKVLDNAPRLKVISKWGTGVDSIDRQAAARRGVAVRNTPGAFTDPVADTAMGYILLFARKFDLMDRDIRSGAWSKRQLMSLKELTLGVVGVGNCGKAVVRRALAFGMRVLGNDIAAMPKDFLDSTGIVMRPLEDLLGEADVVTLHPDLNETSLHLIDAKALARMKPSALLVNTSRGPVVDEAALSDALEKKRISAAALDVFETEPLPASSPLRRLENCWLAPHNANSSPACAQRVHENTMRNLLDELHSRSRT